jgi:predicted phage terminase large subunit-like protein
VDSNGRYEAPNHILKLNRLLLQLSEREITRLAVFLPPRHGKSELISKYFTAYYLATHPDHRVILASYEADFAATWGYKARNILEEHGSSFKDNITVDNNSAARNRWDIKDHQGGMVTAGVGGPITGKGADLLIIDDPVKNAEQANSPTYRERAKDWYRSTAYTRLEPDAAIILIQTRWHEDDLGGWILNTSDEPWTTISFPAIDDNNKALWPERFTISRLHKIRKEIGEYWFNAMYQQNPQPAEGGILKRPWIQYYNPKEVNLTNSTLYTGWDLAISTKETADFTTSCTIKHNHIDNKLYVVDWSREHITFPEQQQAVINNHKRYNNALIGIETNAYQAALPQSLSKHMLPIRGVNRIKDKVTRITSAFTIFEQGQIMLPLDHHLLGEFENEYMLFPTAKHDDLLDATEMAISLVRQGASPFTSSDKSYDYSKRKRESNTNRRRGVRL